MHFTTQTKHQTLSTYRVTFTLTIFQHLLRMYKSKFYSGKLPDKPKVNYTQVLYWITATDSIMDTQRKTNIFF